MAKPKPDFTDAQLEELTSLAAVGLKAAHLGWRFGVSRATWFKWLAADDRLREAVSIGMARNCKALADELRKRAMGGAEDPGSASLLKYACDAAGFQSDKTDDVGEEPDELEAMSDDDVKQAILKQAQEYGI